MTLNDKQPKKIVILGGGMAAMTVAFELTDRPNWQDDYTITLYQMGWRLGGKGASGRNQRHFDRIEEHGLHVWGGFYDNSFRLIQKCYDVLDRPSEVPINTWDKAFMAQEEFYIVQENEKGDWLPWHIHVPSRNSQPGNPENPDQPEPPRSFWDHLLEFMEWIQQHLEKHTPTDLTHPTFHNAFSVEKWGDLLDKLKIKAANTFAHERGQLLATGTKIIHRLGPQDHDDSGSVIDKIKDELIDKSADALVDILNDLRRDFYNAIKEKIPADIVLLRAWILADYGISLMTGVLTGRLYREPFDSINHLTHVEWLHQNGADEITLNSGLVKSLHDIMFAYKDGQLNIEAGTALRSIFRMMRYRGAAIYRMTAGMGDVIFAPFYEVLTRRGVNIEFFHIVRNISPDADGTRIKEIEIGRQVTLKNGSYNPLINVKDLPCWPSNPLYDQLVEGQELESQQIDLERYDAPWKDIDTITLIPGEDFDLAILGISLGSFPDVCPEILKANTAWQAMHSNVLTTPTQSAQFWLKPTLAELGWKQPGPPFVGAVPNTTLDTYTDMAHLIHMENWPSKMVDDIAYMTGVLPIETPPDEALYQAKENAQGVLENIKKLWPTANRLPRSNALPWASLVAPDNIQSIERFYDQYFRGNVLGSERYVLTVAGSTQHRLEGDNSGFSNLYLVGDWTKNGYNLGMIESAVMSGMLTSQAISGYPTAISGLGDFY